MSTPTSIASPARSKSAFLMPTAPKHTALLSNSGLEDIDQLLFLETLIRFRQDETNVRQHVEEKQHQYKQCQKEYRESFGMLVKLQEQLLTNHVLQQSAAPWQEVPVQQCLEDVDAMKKQTITSIVTASVSEDVLQETKKQLAECKQHEQLAQLHEEAVANRDAMHTIHTASTAAENILETTIQQAIEQYVNEFQKFDAEAL